MSIVKPEMISRQVTMHDVLPISFLKMSAYTGSKRSLRYRMEKAEISAADGEADGGQSTAVLRLWYWTGPYAFDLTPPEEMEIADFSFDDDGLGAAIEHLNKQLEIKGI